MSPRDAWLRAISNAQAGGLQCDVLPVRGAVTVPSRSTEGKRYRVQFTPDGLVGYCECPASGPCAHRAAVLLALYAIDHAELPELLGDVPAEHLIDTALGYLAGAIDTTQSAATQAA